MIKKLQNKLTQLVVVAVMGLTLALPLTPVITHAQTKDDLCQGVELVSGQAGCGQPANQPTVDSTIKRVINIMGILVGVISVIMVIIGGLKYVTSGGDSGKVSSAKDTILYAVIGLVVVAMSQVIVRFVITSI